MSTKIVAFSGKKQSGKNTAINFIVGIYMVHLGIVRQKSTINERGQLVISDIFGDTEFCGVFDIYRRDNKDIVNFLEEYIHPYVKVYSFADLLKKVCVKVLGLKYSQCYGTDKDKNSFTNLRWENMPDVKLNFPNDTHPGRCMKAREVMQYVGTQMFRKMLPGVWVDATINQIKDEGTELALITDCRFPDEIEGIQKVGGKIIRLTRNPIKDEHVSETILDKDKFDWSKFDAVIDNANMNIEQQNEATYNVLRPWNYIPEIT